MRQFISHGSYPPLTGVKQKKNCEYIPPPSGATCSACQTEYLLWERTWKKALQDLLASYQSDPQLAVLTLDHLCREKDWTKPQDQAANESVLQDLKQAAQRALFLTPSTAAPKTHFTQVLQGRSEPFVEFVERLTQAVRSQTEGHEFQQQLLTESAHSNTNEACKAVLRALPLDPPPTLDLMVETCVKLVSITPEIQNNKSRGVVGVVSQ